MRLDHDVYRAGERHAELRREAEVLHRLRSGDTPQPPRPHQRLLDTLGRAMIAWGWRLRVRSGTLEWR